MNLILPIDTQPIPWYTVSTEESEGIEGIGDKQMIKVKVIWHYGAIILETLDGCKDMLLQSESDLESVLGNDYAELETGDIVEISDEYWDSFDTIGLKQ